MEHPSPTLPLVPDLALQRLSALTGESLAFSTACRPLQAVSRSAHFPSLLPTVPHFTPYPLPAPKWAAGLAGREGRKPGRGSQRDREGARAECTFRLEEGNAVRPVLYACKSVQVYMGRCFIL